MWVQSLTFLSGLRTRHCRQLWCRWQTWLRSLVAVALAKVSGYSSELDPSLGTSLCHGSSPRKGKRTRKKKKKKEASALYPNRNINLTTIHRRKYLQESTSIQERGYTTLVEHRNEKRHNEGQKTIFTFCEDLFLTPLSK